MRAQFFFSASRPQSPHGFKIKIVGSRNRGTEQRACVTNVLGKGGGGGGQEEHAGGGEIFFSLLLFICLFIYFASFRPATTATQVRGPREKSQPYG